MASLKTSACEARGHCRDGRGGEIVKMGYLRKLKGGLLLQTMKKRFFILRGDSSEASARLEYYEDEKKWKKNHSPRRAISLKTCFNISRRQDTKHKHVIALYTKDDCFGLVLDSEDELEDWLKALLSLQYGEDIVDGEEPKPTFEHVWQVTVLNKGLGNTRNMLGRHLLCLTDRSLSLVKLTQEERAETYEFSLVSVRRCGRSECFFYMEVGRSSCTGEGELWMQTEDTNIADNMHAAILHAMSNNSSKEEQVSRPRSSSTNEVSKPIAMLQRRQTHVGNSSVKEAAPPTRAVPTNEPDPHGHPQQGSGRERSDSVPSRTRTISDGSHRNLVPNCGSSRPHSVCWPAGSPVSPASGPCSTDSPGSSLSIDEGEGEGWGGYGHSLTPDEPVILEENCSDDAMWPGTTSLLPPVRKFSPSQMPTNVSTGSPSQDAYSPHSSSPMDPLGGYITMIQHGTEVSMCQRAPSSSNHSRASSLAEETSNGYVPMAPVDDGYVDMEPGQRYHGEDCAHGEMSPASSCSVTSGTPSTDMRFSEYHLEKVSSYFTPSEEDETSSLDRPTRAYSVGSRPDTMKHTNRLEIANQADASRVRAFSVGSRTVNKLSSRALAYDLYMTRQHPMLTPPHHTGGHHLTPTPTAGGKKSLSAPLLCNSWSGGGTLRHHVHGSSHSSMEPMDDLMEMDFTRNTRGKPKASRGGSKLEEKPSVVNGYVDMSPRSTASRQADVKSGNVIAASPPKSVIPTVSPKTVDYHAQSQPIPTPAKVTGVSSLSPKTVGPYMEMRPGPSPPTKPSMMQRKTSTVDPPFSDIKILNTQPTSDAFCTSSQNFSSVSPYVEMKSDLHHNSFPVTSGCQSRKPTSPIQEEYMDMGKPGSASSDEGYGGVSTVARTAPVDTPHPKKPPEGNVEIAWTGLSRPVQRLSLETYRSNSEDYMNLSFEGHENSKRKEKRKGRYSSQPIVIQAREAEAAIAAGKPHSSSTSPVFSLSSLIGRKHSTGTPPKVPPPAFLPLGHTSSNSPGSSPSSSLRRSHIHKTSRQDSIENTGLITPTGSTVTIFPFSLNSPGSPMKPFPGQQQNKSQAPPLATAPGTDINYELSRKCLVDATSGTVRLSYPQAPYSPESTPTTPDSSSSSSEQPTPVNAESQNDLNKVGSPRSHNYVNYSPFHRIREEPVYGDYALMRPVAVTGSHKTSAPTKVMNLKTDSMDLTTIPDYKSVSRKAPSIAMFCLSETVSTPKLVTSSTTAPNKEAVQFGRQNVTGSGNKVGKAGTVARQLSGSSLGSAEGAISRQLSSSSVESVVTGQATVVSGGSPTSSRPPSVSSERELHYASLDLAPSGSEGEDGSRSPHSIRTQGSLTESSTSSPSPNPVNQGAGEPAFTYAEIDFAKSEGLRNVSCSLNKKLRH